MLYTNNTKDELPHLDCECDCRVVILQQSRADGVFQFQVTSIGVQCKDAIVPSWKQNETFYIALHKTTIYKHVTGLSELMQASYILRIVKDDR